MSSFIFFLSLSLSSSSYFFFSSPPSFSILEVNLGESDVTEVNLNENDSAEVTDDDFDECDITHLTPTKVTLTEDDFTPQMMTRLPDDFEKMSPCSVIDVSLDIE